MINRKLDNGIFVLDTGYRNDIPVVLVERSYDDTCEYIIGFNYKVNDNKMTWGYGYYYDRNIDKAMTDFKRVLNGESLADTFSNKERSDKLCHTR